MKICCSSNLRKSLCSKQFCIISFFRISYTFFKNTKMLLFSQFLSGVASYELVLAFSAPIKYAKLNLIR